MRKVQPLEKLKDDPEFLIRVKKWAEMDSSVRSTQKYAINAIKKYIAVGKGSKMTLGSSIGWIITE